MKNFTIAKLTDLEYTIDDILEFITKLDDDFIPPLSSRVNLNDYAQKIIEKAYCIVGIENNKIIALISFYMNDTIRKKAFITYLGVDKNCRKKNIGRTLLKEAIEIVRRADFREISLQTAETNNAVIDFYQKNDFQIINYSDDRASCIKSVNLKLFLKAVK